MFDVEFCAPVVLFVFNRPDHTKRTIEALQSNLYASSSDLYIYSDSSVDDDSKRLVDEVRAYIRKVTGFKTITIIEQESNLGLAGSIISGVTNIIEKHGRVIVLEDDIVTSPYYLKFMNEALLYYRDKPKVWHISGWNYPITPAQYTNDVFLWRMMNCWGWATWADRWSHFEKNVDKVINELDEDDIYKFNLDGTEAVYNQILWNKKGLVDTWAVFWYATIFRNNGLCVNPSISFVDNIGHDGSGVHCIDVGPTTPPKLNMTRNIEFESELCESIIATDAIKKYYLSQKKNILFRVVRKVFRIFSKNWRSFMHIIKRDV